MKFQCHAHKDLEPGNYNVKLSDRWHGGSLPHGSADFKAPEQSRGLVADASPNHSPGAGLLVPDEGNDSISPSKVGSPGLTRG